MSWTHEEVLALYASYEDGDSLTVIGVRIGISHEAVRGLFNQYGLPLRSAAERGAIRAAANERRAQELSEQIIALYKQHGEIGAVMAGLDGQLPRKYVSQVIDTIPNREAYKRRKQATSADQERLKRDLRRAAQAEGEPLSSTGYRKAAKDLGLAAFNTILRAWDGSWSAALADAGVQGNTPRGPYSHAYTPEQCVAAVARCLNDHKGHRVSFEGYREWADGLNVPSGPTVRNVVGWNSAVDQAFAQLAEAVPS